MAKITQKEKVTQGFLCAQTFKSYANRLKWDAEDFDSPNLKSLAKRMEEEADKYIKIFRS